jgi:putative Mn2+ efflux pump MntP
MEEIFEKSFESRAEVDRVGRLRRPVAVAIVGSFVSFAVGVLTLAKSDGRGATPMAFIAVSLIGTVLSMGYAIIGARVSKNAANKALFVIGTVLVLTGTAYLIHLLKSSEF